MLNASLSLEQLPPEVRDRLLAGMRSPQVVTLPHGELLYRFASSTRSAQEWSTSPWWIRRPALLHIIDMRRGSLAAHGHDPGRALPLGFVARMATAVMQRFSAMDVLVAGQTIQELRVFAGRGRTQYLEEAPNGFKLTWTGSDQVEQVFIPFIDRPGQRHLPAAGPPPAFVTIAGSPAFRIFKAQTIESLQLY